VKFIVRYERARVEFDVYDVEVEAESAFEADLKVRDTGDPKVWVGASKLVECDRRMGLSTRRVMSVKEKTG
jgi:hypothetical protein